MNLAGNFFKDLKENSSINQLGSKIKNISQNSNWLPETKDILASAASSISDVINQTPPPGGEPATAGTSAPVRPVASVSASSTNTSLVNPSSSSGYGGSMRASSASPSQSSYSSSVNVSSTKPQPTGYGASTAASPPTSRGAPPPDGERLARMDSVQTRKIQPQPPLVRQNTDSAASKSTFSPPSQRKIQPQPPVVSNASKIGETSENDDSLYIQSSRPPPPSSPPQPVATAAKPPTKQLPPPPVRQLSQQKSMPLPATTTMSGVRMPPASQQPLSQTLSQPPASSMSMSTQPFHARTIGAEESPHMSPSQSAAAAKAIDPMMHQALQDTNDALKNEVQRLSVFELKYNQLEREHKALQAIKDSNKSLEAEVNELKACKANLESVQAEFKLWKARKAAEDEKLKSTSSQSSAHVERIENENANMKNKLRDLDKLLEEYEAKCNALKAKESAFEEKIRHLEQRLAELEDGNRTNEMHEQKLLAYEQANRILEQELDSLKEQQKAERAKVKDKMELLHQKQTEKLRKLEETNAELAEQLTEARQRESNASSSLNDEIESLRKHVRELEGLERENNELRKHINQMKLEMASQMTMIAEEKKKIEIEKNDMNDNYSLINEARITDNMKHQEQMDELESQLRSLQAESERKEAEINQLLIAKDEDTSNFLAKLNLLNEENVNLANKLKAANEHYHQREEDLNKLRKKLQEMSMEHEKMQAQLKSYEKLENELIDIHMKNANSQEAIQDLEAKVQDWERRYNKDINETKSTNQQQQQQIKQLKQQLTAESLKVENLNADYSLLKLELNKLESLKARCESLERELVAAQQQTSRVSRANEAHRFDEPYDKYHTDLRLYQTQITSLQNDLKVRDEEHKQMEKMVDMERQKSSSLISQLDELTSINTQLTMQFSDAKRKLISLELLNEECNQLRKNLTLMTIESESRKAEIATLNSQIHILETTLKTLRENTEKHSQQATNYETTAYELKKKQEDYRRLQQLHETVKKDQLETIEMLEEKLKDVEKKTELQALKHEEMMLEMESIRARRDRIFPLCPNCSTQMMPIYHSVSQQPSPSPHHHHHQQLQPQQQSSHPAQHSQLMAPHQQQSQLHVQTTQSQNINLQQQQHSMMSMNPQTQQQQQQQPLLSIAIPQQSPLTSSGIGTPYGQFQSPLAQLQLIALPCRPAVSSVTVEIQTSPTSETHTCLPPSPFKYEPPVSQPAPLPAQPAVVVVKPPPKLLKVDKETATMAQPVTVVIPRINASSQTVPEVKRNETKEVNTDPIDWSANQKTVTIQVPVPVPVPAAKPAMSNQAINVNLFEEAEASKPKQVPKAYEEKATQSTTETTSVTTTTTPVQKYFLYTCKYSYDPLKNSPNDNPEAELPLSADEYLFILSQEDDEGFLNGELLNGRRGLVPSNFVEQVQFDPQSLAKNLNNMPKAILTHIKFSECLRQANVDPGQIMLMAQQTIQKIQAANAEMNAQLLASNIVALTGSSNKISNLITNLNEDLDESSIKIGLPYPNNLKVEKRSETSLLATWDPPTAPLNQSTDGENMGGTFDLSESSLSIQSYNLYLNHELYRVINANDELVAVLNDIDLSQPNRISIQVVTPKGAMSKPQECTLIFGSNRSFAPSNLSVHGLSQTSAIVSWWPSSSLFSHIISIDSIEHRTLKPGIFRFKLSGLLPDTSHLVTITAQIPNHVNESSSNYAASVEFRTLALRTLSVPQDLSIEKDPYEPDTYNLSWTPVVSMPNTISNGMPVGGYSIYLDSVRVHQILNPIASTVSLSGKLLFNGAKQLTIRTLSLDGNAESKDSEPIKLVRTQINNPPPLPPQLQASSVPPAIVKEDPRRKSRVGYPEPPAPATPQLIAPVPVPAVQPPAQAVVQAPVQTVQVSGIAQNPKIAPNQSKVSIDSNDLYGSNEMMSAPAPYSSPNVSKKAAMNEPAGSKFSPAMANPAESQPVPPSVVLPNQDDKKPPPLIKPQPTNPVLPPPDSQIQPLRKSITPGNPNQIPKTPLVSEVKRNSRQDSQSIRSNVENDADLYENNRAPPTAAPAMNPIIKTPAKSSKPPPPAAVMNQAKIGPPASKPPPLMSKDSPGGEFENSKPPSQPNQSRNPATSTPSMQTGSGQKNSSSKSSSGSKHQAKQPDFRAFVALFDYDPFKMSPNQDSCSEELPFRAGQYIKVYGDQDADGFYYGEASGRSGYIPCNMISEVDDPEVVKQLMNEGQNLVASQGSQQQSGQKSSKMDGERKSGGGGGGGGGNIKNQNVNSNSSTDSVKTTKGSSGSKSQQQQSGQGKQSFVPIGNYQYKPPGPPQQPNQVKCVMIALYDYDPQSLSPNVDVDIELPFRTGDIINVIGDIDEDGFYMGELNGKKGLVPSNFLQPLDQYQREQEMNENPAKYSSKSKK